MGERSKQEKQGILQKDTIGEMTDADATSNKEFAVLRTSRTMNFRRDPSFLQRNVQSNAATVKSVAPRAASLIDAFRSGGSLSSLSNGQTMAVKMHRRNYVQVVCIPKNASWEEIVASLQSALSFETTMLHLETPDRARIRNAEALYSLPEHANMTAVTTEPDQRAPSPESSWKSWKVAKEREVQKAEAEVRKLEAKAQKAETEAELARLQLERYMVQ